MRCFPTGSSGSTGPSDRIASPRAGDLARKRNYRLLLALLMAQNMMMRANRMAGT